MIISAQRRLLTLSCGSQINVVPTPLRRDDSNSPWCYTFSLSPVIIDDDVITSTLPTRANFLATQVIEEMQQVQATVLRALEDLELNKENTPPTSSQL